MKGGASDARFEVKMMLKTHGRVLVSTNHERLMGPQLLQLLLKPSDSGVCFNPMCFGVQRLRMKLVCVADIKFRRRQRVALMVPIGKARNALARITIEHSACAVSI